MHNVREDPTFVLESDPNEVRRMRTEHKRRISARNASIKQEKAYWQTEELDVRQSAATCNLDDITGITFGATSSRFWMYRK